MHMSPFYLEMLIFLWCKRALWDLATVEECQKEAVETEAAADITEANL